MVSGSSSVLHPSVRDLVNVCRRSRDARGVSPICVSRRKNFGRCYVMPEPSHAGNVSRLSQLIFSRGEVRRAVFLCDDEFAPSIRPLSISAELTRSGTVGFGASRGGGQNDRCISEGLGAPPSPGGPCSRRVKRPESTSIGCAHPPSAQNLRPPSPQYGI